jgi:hypothetical protein
MVFFSVWHVVEPLTRDGQPGLKSAFRPPVGELRYELFHIYDYARPRMSPCPAVVLPTGRFWALQRTQTNRRVLHGTRLFGARPKSASAIDHHRLGFRARTTADVGCGAPFPFATAATLRRSNDPFGDVCGGWLAVAVG